MLWALMVVWALERQGEGHPGGARGQGRGVAVGWGRGRPCYSEGLFGVNCGLMSGWGVSRAASGVRVCWQGLAPGLAPAAGVAAPRHACICRARLRRSSWTWPGCRSRGC